ncbi:unnamed protein product [Symbiodinium microadriaticum]|nr:unnamed protein product [Symbiodinium microadriaticum]CAE7949719.1 unnamed protein product [Symbiodinium sp. KB8]
MNWHETSDQWSWKARCQIIELGAVNLVTGESLLLRSRPEFSWDDVKSAATRLFAEHSGHKAIVCDQGLPLFAQLWPSHVVPFLQRAAGCTGKVVLIAHNGDRFDHFVLSKEITRLGLDMRCCPQLISADPVATLKKRFNNHEIQRLYGQPGGLMLQQMHTNFVPEQRAAGLRSHQALDDVHMMRDVICCAPYLAPSLAQDISLAAHGSEFPNVTYSVWQRFLHPVPCSKPCSPAPHAWCHPVVQSVLFIQPGTMTSTSPVGIVNTAPPPPPQFAAPALQPLLLQPTAQHPSEPQQEVQTQASQTASFPCNAGPPPPSPSPASSASDHLPKQHVADAEASSGGESRRSSSGSIAGVADNHPSSSQGKGAGKVEDKGKGGKGKTGKPQPNQQHQLRYAEGWWDPDANNWDHAWAGAWWGYPSYDEYWAWASGYGQHRPRGRANRNNRRRPAQRPANQEPASESVTNEPAPDAPKTSKTNLVKSTEAQYEETLGCSWLPRDIDQQLEASSPSFDGGRVRLRQDVACRSFRRVEN